MEIDLRQKNAFAQSPNDAGAVVLGRWIEENASLLLSILRSYLRSAGLFGSAAGTDAAQELLNDVVVEAFRHADRFDSTRPPRAWLLGIAINLIKRRKVAVGSQRKNEMLMCEVGRNDVLDNDEALFDLLEEIADESASGKLEARLDAQRLLAKVPDDDQTILRMRWFEGMDGTEIARALNISPGAARARLMRAMDRLREAASNPPNKMEGRRDG
jgi:RNA polymerase sigma factor (sigma-70 family)